MTLLLMHVIWLMLLAVQCKCNAWRCRCWLITPALPKDVPPCTERTVSGSCALWLCVRCAVRGTSSEGRHAGSFGQVFSCSVAPHMPYAQQQHQTPTVHSLPSVRFLVGALSYLLCTS